jgi:hypothetical protein
VASQPSRAPRVVAELGRPETPEETAARKAENSRRRRSNQTLLNLILALAASLAVVLFLVLVVVRPDGTPPPAVNYRSDATESRAEVGHTLAAPTLPSGWKANTDSLNTGSDGVVAWSIGLITPSQEFVGVIQGIKANPTWVANQLQGAQPTGNVTIDGVTWRVYDRRTAADAGNFAYSLSTVTGVSSIVLHGTASRSEFATLAGAITTQLAGAK